MVVSEVDDVQSWRKGGEPVWHTFSMEISALSIKHFEEDILKQKSIQWEIVMKSIFLGKKLKDHSRFFKSGWKTRPNSALGSGMIRKECFLDSHRIYWTEIAINIYCLPAGQEHQPDDNGPSGRSTRIHQSPYDTSPAQIDDFNLS